MTVQVVEGDLLDQPVDCIVNSWNRNIIPWWLLFPQGIAGAIKKRAGIEPFLELGRKGPIPLGGAVLTSPGNLPFKGIIHVAGINMWWRSSEEAVRASVRNALALARQQGFRSIALPLIGAGVGSENPERAMKIVIEEASSADFEGEIRIVVYKKAAGSAWMTPKKYYILAAVALFLIPVAMMAGMGAVIAINPEIAVHTSNYARNFWLLETTKRVLMLATLLSCGLLWLLTGFSLLKAKQRSYRWLPLTLLGPLGFIVLTMLKDETPGPRSRHQRFVGGMGYPTRFVYEAVFLYAVYMGAYQCIYFKHTLMTLAQAAASGMTYAQVVAVQNASSGMWAFGDWLQELFLIVVVYLLWPACFNALAWSIGWPKETAS